MRENNAGSNWWQKRKELGELIEGSWNEDEEIFWNLRCLRSFWFLITYVLNDITILVCQNKASLIELFCWREDGKDWRSWKSYTLLRCIFWHREGRKYKPCANITMLAAAAVSEELGSIFTYVLTLQGCFSSVSLLCLLHSL